MSVGRGFEINAVQRSASAQPLLQLRIHFGSAEQFEASQKYLRWQDRAANRAFFAGPHAEFSREAANLLLEIGIIKQIPDLKALADTSFIK